MTDNKLAETLRELLEYSGGAASALEDDYVLDRARTALADYDAHAAEAAQHPDDAAVDAFAGAMKAKLAAAREKGRGGWQDKDDCPQQRLSDMLRAHVEKGDPCDVANFCMFLHQRDEPILPAETAQPVDRSVCEWAHGLAAGYLTPEDVAQGIRAALSAQPAAQAEVCQNCGEQLPVGCCGVFIDEKSCMYTSAQKEHPNG